MNAAVVDLFWRWLLVGALAFGGGQAALSLVERSTVTDAGWISPGDFSTAVGFSFVTPGPVLILATFIGYRVAGIAGAVAATVGVFLVPWFLATAAAHLLRHLIQHAWLRAFSRGAGPAIVALLVVSALSVTRATYTGPLYAFIALAALALGLWRKIHPFAILAGGALIGAASALIGGTWRALSSSLPRPFLILTPVQIGGCPLLPRLRAAPVAAVGRRAVLRILPNIA